MSKFIETHLPYEFETDEELKKIRNDWMNVLKAGTPMVYYSDESGNYQEPIYLYNVLPRRKQWYKRTMTPIKTKNYE